MPNQTTTMSPRTLFIIILRVLGIYSVKATVLELLELLPFFVRYNEYSQLGNTILLIILQCLIATAYFIVSWALVFRAAYLVDRFDLAKDLPPVLPFGFQTRDALRIALVITAAILLVTEIPAFVSLLANLFESERESLYGPVVERSWSPMVISGIKVLIGFLLIGERKRILDILLNDSNNNPVDPPAEDAPEQQEKDLFPHDH